MITTTPDTTPWQPDWSSLNAIAASFLASTPLAARIASVTPPGSYVSYGLQLDLVDIMAAVAKLDPLTGALVIAVDTLFVPAGSTTIAASGVMIVARSVQVAEGGSAGLVLRGDTTALQLVTAEIVGDLSVTYQRSDGSTVDGPAAALVLASGPVPQVLTTSSTSPGAVTSTTDATSIADVMHSPWSVLALQLSGAIAGVLVDEGESDAMALAAAMLRWVTASCQDLLQQQQEYSTVDWTDIASQLSSAIALLTFTQTAASGATYVPVLSADQYQAQINGLLDLASTYETQIDAFNSQDNVDRQLAALATTLGNINSQAAGPLISTLSNLANETDLVETQLRNASLQLQQIGATLPDLYKALDAAIQDEFQKSLIKAAFTTLFTVVNLYVSLGVSLLDPALLSENAAEALNAAMKVTESLVKEGSSLVLDAIEKGLDAAENGPSNTDALAAAQTGAQVLSASMLSFGQAVNALWAVVAVAIANPGHIDYSPDFLAKLQALPDLSGFTVGGLDPTTYWNAVVVQTQAFVKPYANLSEAQAYLTAVQLCATYGAAVGDLQSKLLDLYTQGMSAFTRLQAVYQAQDQWNALQSSLAQQEQQIAAAVGLLQRGYLDVKRSLVVAVDNYRAAFAYQWLQQSSIRVDVSMNYLQLKAAANSSITSLQNVLKGSDGSFKPPQAFDGITVVVTRDDAPLFTSVDGKGQAQWYLTPDQLAGQLGGNTAAYLTEATFELVGATQTDEVELVISTSGRYETQYKGASFRFVSEAVSMNNYYQPGDPPRFITRWRFADPAAYMAPTPYTNWTLSVLQGNWQSVTAIKVTLSGRFLQN